MRFGLRLILLSFGVMLWASSAVQAATCKPPEGATAANPLICEHVVRIRCPSNGRTATGFVSTVDGLYGVVTALHAVVDCVPGEIELKTATGDQKLSLSRANLARDAALLTGLGDGGPGLTIAPLPHSDREFYIVGYHFGSLVQRGIWLAITHPVLGPLGEIPNPPRNSLAQRDSPSLRTLVIFFEGEINRGHSGAPILDTEGRAVAIADGGLKEFGSDLVWAIPLAGLQWTESAAAARSYLAGRETAGLASFGSDQPPPELPALILADAYDTDGVLYRRLPNGEISLAFRGREKPFGSFATHPPSGRMVLARNNEILELQRNGTIQTLYTHDDLISGVGFNPPGELFFSTVDQHDTRTGFIWQLRAPSPRIYEQFSLHDMRNHWIGDFAFSPDGSIWLSNGNLTAASLYEIVDGRPKHRYTPPARPIGGFVFKSEDVILYSDLSQTIYSLYLPTMTEGEEFRLASARRLSDVALVPSAETDPTTIVAGYLMVWSSSKISRPEDVRPNMTICGTSSDLGLLARNDPNLAAANLLPLPPHEWVVALETGICEGFIVDDYALLSSVLGHQANAFRRIEITAK